MAEVGRVTEKLALQHLMKLAMNQDASEQVRAVSFYKIKELKELLDSGAIDKDDYEKMKREIIG